MNMISIIFSFAGGLVLYQYSFPSFLSETFLNAGFDTGFATNKSYRIIEIKKRKTLLKKNKILSFIGLCLIFVSCFLQMISLLSK